MTVEQNTCPHNWETVDITPLGATRHRLFDYCELCGKRGDDYDGELMPEPDQTHKH